MCQCQSWGSSLSGTDKITILAIFLCSVWQWSQVKAIIFMDLFTFLPCRNHLSTHPHFCAFRNWWPWWPVVTLFPTWSHKRRWHSPKIQQNHLEPAWNILLVGGIPTPLKNDGVRQLGWWNSQYMESHKTYSKPPTSLLVNKSAY